MKKDDLYGMEGCWYFQGPNIHLQIEKVAGLQVERWQNTQSSIPSFIQQILLGSLMNATLQINGCKRDTGCSLSSLISSVAENKAINQATLQNYIIQWKVTRKYPWKSIPVVSGTGSWEGVLWAGCAECVFLNYEREDRMYKDPGEGKTRCFWITKTEVGQFKRYLGV